MHFTRLFPFFALPGDHRREENACREFDSAIERGVPSASFGAGSSTAR